MESPQDPASWGYRLSSLTMAVYWSATYQAQIKTRTYKNTLVFAPGDLFMATAYAPTTGWWNGFAQFYHQAQTWQTVFHEMGHTWGMHHAGGYWHTGEFNAYLDDAIMGYQREWRAVDCNAVHRYRLGWLTGAETVEFTRGTGFAKTVNLAPLNEGPDGPEFLLMKLPCDECVGDKAATPGEGFLYISFRVQDGPSLYGVGGESDPIYLFDIFTRRRLVLADRVHVHFQPDVNQKTELWTTLNAGDTVAIPAANMWIHVCGINVATHAKVSVSDTSEAAAWAGCATPAPTRAPTPAPSAAATPTPTMAPTPSPTLAPTAAPTPAPTPTPTPAPTPAPTLAPTQFPTPAPTPAPTPTPTPHRHQRRRMLRRQRRHQRRRQHRHHRQRRLRRKRRHSHWRLQRRRWEYRLTVAWSPAWATPTSPTCTVSVSTCTRRARTSFCRSRGGAPAAMRCCA
ncbi:unnamed protein product [Prorocentrum cordatum]|uniref:Peptidase M11 gametolysin domain-containing protein n=1 Tax=Prorocentrum cordatum TaxID=2364126 RepID=A0ABN9R5C8_9DINO|nr:unnamed protein product [Polarella glacialis]